MVNGYGFSLMYVTKRDFFCL